MHRILQSVSLCLLNEQSILRNKQGRIIVNANGIYALDDSIEEEILQEWNEKIEWCFVNVDIA